MSEALTRHEDFRATPPMPSARALSGRRDRDSAGQLRGMFVAATLGATVAHPDPSLTSTDVGAAWGFSQDASQPSSTALNRAAESTRVSEFASTLREAINLSEELVEEGEAPPLDPQTWAYAVWAISPFIASMELPAPLILPLQRGGIGIEWHEAGLNIELRFRSPFHVYAVLEDARGAIPSFYGRDPHLVRTRSALRELSVRAVG